MAQPPTSFSWRFLVFRFDPLPCLEFHVLLRAIWDKYSIFRHGQKNSHIVGYIPVHDTFHIVLVISPLYYPHWICLFPDVFLFPDIFLIFQMLIYDTFQFLIEWGYSIGSWYSWALLISPCKLSIAHPLAIWGGTNDAFDSPGRAIWAFLGCPVEAGGDFCWVPMGVP